MSLLRYLEKRIRRLILRALADSPAGGLSALETSQVLSATEGLVRELALRVNHKLVAAHRIGK